MGPDHPALRRRVALSAAPAQPGQRRPGDRHHPALHGQRRRLGLLPPRRPGLLVGAAEHLAGGVGQPVPGLLRRGGLPLPRLSRGAAQRRGELLRQGGAAQGGERRPVPQGVVLRRHPRLPRLSFPALDRRDQRQGHGHLRLDPEEKLLLCPLHAQRRRPELRRRQGHRRRRRADQALVPLLFQGPGPRRRDLLRLHRHAVHAEPAALEGRPVAQHAAHRADERAAEQVPLPGVRRAQFRLLHHLVLGGRQGRRRDQLLPLQPAQAAHRRAARREGREGRRAQLLPRHPRLLGHLGGQPHQCRERHRSAVNDEDQESAIEPSSAAGSAGLAAAPAGGGERRERVQK